MATDVGIQVEQYFSQYPLRSYSKGQILIYGGDNPQYIYFIEEGKIRQYDISYKGDEIVVNIYKKGAFFPMLWAMTRIDNRFFFDVEENVKLRVAPVDEVMKFLYSNPSVLNDLLKRVYVGMDALLNKIVHLMSGSALNRILYELMVECRRSGVALNASEYIVNINENDLAGRTGLSRETVSRELTKVKKKLRLTINRKSITIGNLNVLEDILESTH